MARSDQWYYSADRGSRTGPVRMETLRCLLQDKVLSRDCLVWHPGMPHWQLACNVPELEGDVQLTRPPLPAMGPSRAGPVVPARAAVAPAPVVPEAELATVMADGSALTGVEERRDAASSPESSTIPYPEAPIGLGGWLSISYVGLPLGVLKGLGAMNSAWMVFSDPDWQTMTTSGTDRYVPGLAPLMILSIINQAGLVAILIFAMISFYSWKRRTIRLMVLFLVLQVVVMAVEYVAAEMIFPKNHLDLQTQVIGSLVVAVIWVPYWLRSKRVANTFYY